MSCHEVSLSCGPGVAPEITVHTVRPLGWRGHQFELHVFCFKPPTCPSFLDLEKSCLLLRPNPLETWWDYLHGTGGCSSPYLHLPQAAHVSVFQCFCVCFLINQSLKMKQTTEIGVFAEGSGSLALE